MHLRTFILREPKHAAAMVAFVKEHAGAHAKRGTPLEVAIGVHRARRSAAANAFMWSAVLAQISEQVEIDGKAYTAETWHEWAKREFLPDVTASGKQKWEALPGGELRLAIGTSDLNDFEFGQYLERLQAHAATEWGVHFDRAA